MSLLLLCLMLLGPMPAANARNSSGAGDVDSLLSSPPASEQQASLASAYGQLPLSFEANQGQADPSVDFVAHGQGYSLSLAHAQALLALHHPAKVGARIGVGNDQQVAPDTSSVIGIQLIGAATQLQAIGQQQLPGVANYLAGNDPTSWLTNVPTYASVEYQAVYPGIDLIYDGHHGQLEYTFVLSPGSDPSSLNLGIQGADNVRLDEDGTLLVETHSGDIRQQRPIVYQVRDGVRQTVACRYLLTNTDQGSRVGFEVGAYDATQALIIDPVLVYSTYLGGSGAGGGGAITVDETGNTYIAGSTQSLDFPTTPGAFQQQPGDLSSYGGTVLTKLNAAGSALVYSTYIGGGLAGASGIAVDGAGNAYITGSAFQLNNTTLPDYPTTAEAFQSTFRGASDAFVTKLNASGTALVYSTFLGGSSDDEGSGIAVDAAGNAYVTGSTASPDFPVTPGAFQTSFGGGTCHGGPCYRGFVTKLNASGSALAYSTFLGGSGRDLFSAIALDQAEDAYVTGSTSSADFPTTAGAVQPGFRSGPPNSTGDPATDPFVTKLDTNGSALLYSTFLGGGATPNGTRNGGSAIAVDATGAAYVVGSTGAADFPVTPGALQPTFRGVPSQGNEGTPNEGFVSKLNTTGTSLVYSTFLGGSSGEDFASGVALDGGDNIYVAGTTGSADFPVTPGALQPTFRGGPAGIFTNRDGFVSKLNSAGSNFVYSTFLGGNGTEYGGTIVVDRVGNAYVSGSTQSSDFPTTPGAFQQSLRSAAGNGFVAKIAPGQPACEVAALLPGPPAQMQVAVQAEGGLSSLTVTEASNASVAMPTFTPGTTDTLLVTATKLDQSTSSSVTLQATDQAGGVTDCDPALVSVGREPGVPRSVTLHHVAHSESRVMIRNGAPGLTELRLHVNGHTFIVYKLTDGQTRTLDVSSAMRKGERNSITVQATGPRGSSATVLVSDH